MNSNETTNADSSSSSSSTDTLPFLSASVLARIVASAHATLDQYEQILDLPRPLYPPNFVFWDSIVLTTADQRQKRAFEAQIASKRRKKQLPDVQVRVIADPPGNKIGNGGSTLWILKKYVTTCVLEKGCLVQEIIYDYFQIFL